MSEAVGACVTLKSSLVISGYKGESNGSFCKDFIWWDYGGSKLRANNNDR